VHFPTKLNSYNSIKEGRSNIIEEKNMNGYKAEVAEWSKAVDLGSIPKGRGFKPHLLHFLFNLSIYTLRFNKVYLSSLFIDFRKSIFSLPFHAIV
jgi:hypothetical protein